MVTNVTIKLKVFGLVVLGIVSVIFMFGLSY
jgi:hypothetical protein